jgi:hypothetical protein
VFHRQKKDALVVTYNDGVKIDMDKSPLPSMQILNIDEGGN